MAMLGDKAKQKLMVYTQTETKLQWANTLFSVLKQYDIIKNCPISRFDVYCNYWGIMLHFTLTSYNDYLHIYIL